MTALETGDLLRAATPESWLEAASGRVPELLIDHANCELKAASSALSLIYRYSGHTRLCDRMSRLAREELRHFEQVRKILAARGIEFRRLSASRYAGQLHDCVKPGEPARLRDLLLVGALIEARSCERFGAIAPLLDAELRRFYEGLLASEARHFREYLELAESESRASSEEVSCRARDLAEIEAGLITSPDGEFRFHSGVPARRD